MNKYQQFSQADLYRRCTGKAAYETAGAAAIKNVRPYHCRHCGKWHRASTLPKPATVRSPKRTTQLNRKAL